MPIQERFLKPKLAASLGVGLVLVAGFALLNLNSRMSSALRFASYDWAYDLSWVKQRPPSAEAITMIYIDEASYVDFQQPFNQPWDRSIHARLLDRLAADGAKAVIFDVVFSDPGPDPETDKKFTDAIRRNGHVILAADYSENRPSSDTQGRSVEMTLVMPYAPFAEAAAAFDMEMVRKYLEAVGIDLAD